MHRTLVLFSLISCFAGHLPAEPIQLSGPVEGFTFDMPTRSFRAVLGLPGSATVGGAILENFEQGSVAPRKDYGIGLIDSRYMVVTGLSTVSPSSVELSGVNEKAEGIAWSGDSSVAVLFSRTEKWIQTVSRLPDAPTTGTPLDLSLLPGSWSAIAADSSGKQIAIGVTGESGEVYLIADGATPLPLFASSNPVALSFSEDGRQLYSVDGATLQITIFELNNYTSQSFSLDGLADPIAIKSTRDLADRKVLLVAGRNDHLLRIYDASSQQILADFPLDFSPTQLGDFGRNSLLLTTRSSGADPLWLFTAAPRQDVFFVPASPAASGGQP